MNNSQNEQPATESVSVKLPPLPRKLDGEFEEHEIKFEKCKHVLIPISSTEVRCKKCHAGWTGQGVIKLIFDNHK